MANTKILLQVVVISCILYIFSSVAEGSSKVKLTDVKTLTLHNGEMTKGRRVAAIPQIKCIGGSAGCYAFTPSVIQCYNRGTDGFDVQWECKTDMDKAYKFGKVEVVCEGYDYPDDPYILKGSCGVEYMLETSSHKDSSSSYYSGMPYSSKKSSWMGDIIVIAIVGIIIYGIYHTCMGNQNQHAYSTTDDGSSPDDHRRSNYGGGSGSSWFRSNGSGAPPPGFRPEYYSSGSGASCGRSSYYSQGSSMGSGGGGFWTGAATGGILGYMMGNRGGYGSSYGQTSYGPSTSSWGGGSSGFSSGSSGGSRETSGFGGTRRR